MSGFGGLIVGLPWLVAVLALLVIFRRERKRAERGLPPSTSAPLAAVYRVLAVAIVAAVAYAIWPR
jgi:hypothetical protein